MNARQAWEFASFAATTLRLHYLKAYKVKMSETEARPWNRPHVRQWCRREEFHNALPLLLRGEDPQFQGCLRRIAREQRGGIVQPS